MSSIALQKSSSCKDVGADTPIEIILKEHYVTASDKVRDFQERMLEGTYGMLFQSVADGDTEEFIKSCKAAAKRHTNVCLKSFLLGLSEAMQSDWEDFSPADVLPNRY